VCVCVCVCVCEGGRGVQEYNHSDIKTPLHKPITGVNLFHANPNQTRLLGRLRPRPYTTL